MAVQQGLHANFLRNMDEFGPNHTAFKELRRCEEVWHFLPKHSSSRAVASRSRRHWLSSLWSPHHWLHLQPLSLNPDITPTGPNAIHSLRARDPGPRKCWICHDPGISVQKEGGLDRCFQHRLGSAVWWQTSFQPLVERGESASHQLPGNAANMFRPLHHSNRPSGTPLVSPLRQHDSRVVYKNRQGALSSKCLFILVDRLLEWAQLSLNSLRAPHVPGRLKQGADMLPWNNVHSDE